MDTTLLRNLGLTEGEIKTYFALLEHGDGTSGQLSKASGVHTSKIYPILDRLIQKGLASYIIQNNVRKYQAAPPEQLIEYSRQKRRELESQEEEIRTLIPQIELKRRLAGVQQSAAVHEGPKGVQTLFETMLDEWRQGDEYLVFSPGEEFQGEAMNKFFLKHHLRRIERGVTVKVLALERQRAYYEKKYRHVKGFAFRYTALSLPAGINIVRDKVSTLIWHPVPTAFVIDSPYIAKEYKEFFRRLWDTARP